MSKNSFFAESITLPNGVSILTDCDSLTISFEDFDYIYRIADSLFAECDIENLNYETLIELLLNPDVTEDEIAKLLSDSLR